MTEADIKYMTEAIVADLAELLSADMGSDIAETLDIIYNSDTYSRLMNPGSGLYFQSSLYVYSFLKNEMTTGRIA